MTLAWSPGTTLCYPLSTLLVVFRLERAPNKAPHLPRPWPPSPHSHHCLRSSIWSLLACAPKVCLATATCQSFQTQFATQCLGSAVQQGASQQGLVQLATSIAESCGHRRKPRNNDTDPKEKYSDQQFEYRHVLLPKDRDWIVQHDANQSRGS